MLPVRMRLYYFVAVFLSVWFIVYLAGQMALWQGKADPFPLVWELLIALAMSIASLFVDGDEEK